MKKLFWFASVLAIVLLCTVTMLVLPATAETYAGDCGKVEGAVLWSFDSETGALTISGSGEMQDFASSAPWAEYRQSIKSVVIEDGVTSIGDRAFNSCTALQTVSVPASVTKIGDYAFRFCDQLESVTFAANSQLTSIGRSAFEECSSLSGVNLTADMPVSSIGAYAFAYCSSLTDITIPRTVTAINEYTFHYCVKLENVNFALSSQLQSIGAHAFRNCKALTSFAIPNGVTSIGASAFRGCSALAALTVPASVVSVGDELFDGCVVLQSVYYNGASEDWSKVSCGAYNEALTGALRFYGEDHTHLYGMWENYDAESHRMVCVCGDVKETQAHTWNAGVVTLEPTHLTEGVLTQTCQDCGATQNKAIEKRPEHTYGAWTPADDDQHQQVCECGDVKYADHTWDEGTEILAPTHLTGGQKLKTCTECGHTKIFSIDRVEEGHIYGNWVSADDMNHHKICACGHVLESASHNWNAGEITTPSTHITEGKKTYTCTDCAETKTEALAKLEGHLYNAIAKVDESDNGKTDSEGNPVTALTHHKHVCACGDATYESHIWDKGSQTLAPTHLTEGEKTYTCKTCAQTKNEAIEKLAAHVFGDWTWDDEDYHKRECACGAEDSVKREEHDFSGWTSLSADQHVRTCVCGDQVAQHNWDAGVETVAATHLTEGEKTYTCIDCRATKVEATTKLPEHSHGAWTDLGNTHGRACACGDIADSSEHEWNEGEIIIPATHLMGSLKKMTCTVCGATKEERDTTDMLPEHTYDRWVPFDSEKHQKCCACDELAPEAEYAPHNWDNGVVKIEPTHLTTGEKELTCTDCGATKTETVAKLTTHTYNIWTQCDDEKHQKMCACGQKAMEFAPHSWNAGEVIKNPTHLEMGEKKLTCTVCGEVKIEKLATVGDHTYGDWEAHDDAQHKKTCACGDVQYVDHNWNDGETTKEPTEKENGEKAYACEDCGATKTEELDMLPKPGFFESVWFVVTLAAVAVIIVIAVIVRAIRKKANKKDPSSAVLTVSSLVGMAWLMKRRRF